MDSLLENIDFLSQMNILNVETFHYIICSFIEIELIHNVVLVLGVQQNGSVINTYTHICICTHVHIHMHTYVCVCTYIYMCVYKCVCVYVWLLVAQMVKNLPAIQETWVFFRTMAQSCLTLSTPWTQQSMEFSRPEYWSG